MRKLLPYFLCLLTSYTYGQKTLTLEQVIEIALENNYTIKIARNNNEITENNLSLGNAGFLPTITATADRTYGIQSFDRELSSGVQQSQSGAKNERTSYGAALSWTIFDGMRMFTTYEQLEELKLQSEDALQAEIELLIYNLTSSFYMAALEKERLVRYDSNVLLSEQRLKVSKDKYDLGKASKLEYLQAQVDLNADKSLRIQQTQALAVRKLELNRLMAIDDTSSFKLQYVLENNEELVLSDLLENLESQNPLITSLKREKAIAEYNTKINMSERLPTVNFNTSYARSKSTSPAGFAIENTSDDINYGLSASWTLFNGFNIKEDTER